MPPGKRSSSSSRSSSSVSHHSSSSSYSSGSVSRHSSSSSYSSGSVSYHSSSSSRSYTSSYGRSYGSGFGSGSRGSSNYYDHSEPDDRHYGVTEGKSFRNTTARGGGTRSLINGRMYHYGVARNDELLSSNDPIVLDRIIKNQPPGYPKEAEGYEYPVQYHCVEHDYVYYAKDWWDNKSNIFYRKGYYDEDGILHGNLVLLGIPDTMQVLQCPYCKTELKLKWTEEGKKKCPKCGGILDASKTDRVLDKQTFVANDSYGKKKRGGSLIGKIIAVMLVLALGTTALNWGKRLFEEKEPVETEKQESIYVEEIGRTCEWLSYDEGYYDPVTDCYFLYNDEIEYPDWQYWYEGISSDFEESGWMEYREDKGVWMIEESAGHWIELPETYNTENLWHLNVEEK